MIMNPPENFQSQSTDTPSPAITARDLTRYYGGQRGVRDLTLDVPSGSVMGLLGENGSGKTTFLKLAMGAIYPNRGEVRTLGEDPARMPPAVRARIGYVADKMDVPGWMQLRSAMELQASFFPSWDAPFAHRLAERLDLRPTMSYKSLSLGQQRRYMLALVLPQRPDLLVLDEPAGGLDTAVRRLLLDVLLEMLSERPMTILFSSHILSDVERIVDRVAFMKDGRAICAANLEDLKSQTKRLVFPTTQSASILRTHFKVIQESQSSGAHLAVVADYSEPRLRELEALTSHDITLEHLNLEEIYLAYTSGSARVSAPFTPQEVSA